MSKEQQLQLDAILRQGGLDTNADVPTLRAAFDELVAQVPVAPDVQQNPVEIGGVAGIQVTIHGNEAENATLSGSPSGWPSRTSRSCSISRRGYRTSSRRMRASSTRPERRWTEHQTL
jgi:hypothetical protein